MILILNLKYNIDIISLLFFYKTHLMNISNEL